MHKRTFRSETCIPLLISPIGSVYIIIIDLNTIIVYVPIVPSGIKKRNPGNIGQTVENGLSRSSIYDIDLRNLSHCLNNFRTIRFYGIKRIDPLFLSFIKMNIIALRLFINMIIIYCFTRQSPFFIIWKRSITFNKVSQLNPIDKIDYLLSNFCQGSRHHTR